MSSDSELDSHTDEHDPQQHLSHHHHSAGVRIEQMPTPRGGADEGDTPAPAGASAALSAAAIASFPAESPQADEMSSIGLGAPPAAVAASSGSTGGSSPTPPTFTGPTGAGVLVLATSSSASASAAAAAAGGPSGGASHPAAPLSPFDALTPGSDVLLTDYKKVTHSFAIVAGQVGAGLESLRSVAEFVKRVCQAKANYAAELLKTSGAFANGGLPAPSSALQLRGTDKGSKNSGAGGGDLLIASEDAMTSSSRIWGELREQLFEEARQEQEFSAKVLSEVCAPMMSYYTEAVRRARVLTAHHQALAGQIKALNEGSLLQAKIASVRLLTALQAQESRERDAALTARHTNPDPLSVVPAPPVHAKGEDPNASEKSLSSSKKNFEASTRKALASVGSFFKSLGKKGAADKEKEKAEKEKAEKESKENKDAAAAAAAAGSVVSPAEGSSASGSAASAAIDSALAIHGGETSEELREKLYLSSLSYKLAVASSNARQDQLYESDLPSLFVELQRLEVGRLNCLRHYLSVLAGANMSLVGPNKQRVQSLLQSVASMQSESDTREFTAGLIASVGEVVKPNGYVYDLSFAPAEIRGAKMDPALIAAPAASASAESSSSAPSYFTSALSVQMDLADNAGAHHLDVPRVFSTLLAAIRLRKGYHRSTLFFTAAPVADIVALRARMESGDFETKDVSLDVLANTLKLWMRLLPEPLIPAPLYSAAIQSVKKDAAVTLAERHAAAEAAAAAQAKPAASSQPQAASVQSLDGIERVPSASAAAAAPLSPTAGAAASPSPSLDRPRSASMGSSSAHLVLPPVSSSQLPSPQLHQYVQAIYSALPTLHQRILSHLATLLSDLASSNSQVLVSALPPSSPRLASPGEDQLAATGPSSVAVVSGSSVAGGAAGASGVAASTVDWSRWANCMMHNASVFAPSILRNTQGDATELLSNAKNEHRFTGALLMSLAQVAQARSQSSGSAGAGLTLAVPVTQTASLAPSPIVHLPPQAQRRPASPEYAAAQAAAQAAALLAAAPAGESAEAKTDGAPAAANEENTSSSPPAASRSPLLATAAAASSTDDAKESEPEAPAAPAAADAEPSQPSPVEGEAAEEL